VVPGRESTQAATGLPDVGTLIQVFRGELAEQPAGSAPEGIPSRIEEVGTDEPAQLLIAAPAYTGDVELPPAGSPYALTWATSREMLELPVALVGAERAGPLLRVWRMEVTGPAVRVQRRNYGRVPTSLPVIVAPLDPPIGDESTQADADPTEAGLRIGRTVDLSEGGIMCTLPPPAFSPDTKVLVRLTVQGLEIDLPAVVLRSIVTRDRGGAANVVTAIRFDDPDEYGDVVRRVVFAEQALARRRGLL
jgi:hypothetical protein